MPPFNQPTRAALTKTPPSPQLLEELSRNLESLQTVHAMQEELLTRLRHVMRALRGEVGEE